MPHLGVATHVQAPMPVTTDLLYPPKFATALNDPTSGTQQANSVDFPLGFAPGIANPPFSSSSGRIATPGVQHTAVQINGLSRAMIGAAEWYDAFGARTAVPTSGTPNQRVSGNLAGQVLPTGSIQQTFSISPTTAP